MAHAQKPDFVFRRNRTSPFKSAGASVQSTTGSRGVRISDSNAGYTMFRGSVKGTGYPLHSSVSPSLPHPCVKECHHISTGVYQPRLYVGGGWTRSTLEGAKWSASRPDRFIPPPPGKDHLSPIVGLHAWLNVLQNTTLFCSYPRFESLNFQPLALSLHQLTYTRSSFSGVVMRSSTCGPAAFAPSVFAYVCQNTTFRESPKGRLWIKLDIKNLKSVPLSICMYRLR